MSQNILRRTAIIGGAAAIAMTGWLAGRTTGVSAADADLAPVASHVAVDCEPSQQALVRQLEVDGETRTVVQCATSAPAPAFTRATAPAGAPSLVPAVYRPTAPAATRVASAPAPVVQRTVAESPAAEKRSWQKRAMVIGGSAGAGAGIGALIGGKKGALIGAAVGGGGGTVYEIVKH